MLRRLFPIALPQQLLLCLLLVFSFSSEAIAAEKQIGTACSGDTNSADWDTIAACQSSVFVRSPYFFGATATGCTGTYAGLVQWTGTSFQGCNGTSWSSLGSGGSSVLGSLASAPSPYSSYAATTGLYSDTATAISIAIGGTQHLRISNDTSGAILNIVSATGVLQINSLNAIKLTADGNPIIGPSGMSPTLSPDSIAIGYQALNLATATEAKSVAIGFGALAHNVPDTGWIGKDHTAVGYYALADNTSGNDNTAIGAGAMMGNQTGSQNVAIGSWTLMAGGYMNVAVGNSALAEAVGDSNTAVGVETLYGVVGDKNTAIGYYALNNSTTANNNTAVGADALTDNSTGSANTALGVGALSHVTSGTNNIGIGYYAGGDTTTGSYNVAIGNGIFNTSNYSVGIGHQALFNLSGDGTTAIGTSAGYNITTGAYNVLLGYWTGSTITTGGRNVVIGPQVASTVLSTGTGNILIGVDSTTTTPAAGTSNWIRIGNAVRLDNDSAVTNLGTTAIGYGALSGNTSGARNTTIGYQSLTSNTTGGDNNAHGYQALLTNSTGSYNSAFGNYALQLNSTGVGNSAFGYGSLSNATATNNTGFGMNTLSSTTLGGGNTAMGNNALYANSTGSKNVGLGLQALTANTSGSNNIAVGTYAGSIITTGKNNTIVGYAVGSTVLTTGTGNILIGVDNTTTTPVAGTNNFLRIGNAIRVDMNDAEANGSITGIGRDALANASGYGATAVGAYALGSNTTGSDNTAVGTWALAQQTVEQGNTGLGYGALFSITWPDFNTAVGYNSLYKATTGNANVALGYATGSILTTGSNNTIIGTQVASTVLTTGTGNILIGVDNTTTTPAAGTSNFLNIGNWIYGIPGYVAIGRNTISDGYYTGVNGYSNNYALEVVGPGSITDIQWVLNVKQPGNDDVSTPYGTGIKLSQGGKEYDGTENEKWSGIAAVNEAYYANESGLAFYANEYERLRISATGFVGIGTQAPSFALEAIGNTGTTAGEHVVSSATQYDETTSNGTGIKLGYRADGTVPTGGFVRSINGYALYLGTTLVPQTMTMNSGYVGIGTTDPYCAMEAIQNTGTSAGDHVVLKAGQYDETTSNGTGIKLGYMADGTVPTGGFVRSTNGYALFLGTSAVPQTMTMNSGYVGVGTTDPQALLDIGTDNSGEGLLIHTDSNSYLFRQSNSSSWPSSDSGMEISIGSSGNRYIYIYNEGTNVASLAVQGNLAVGTPSPSTAVQNNGMDVVGPVKSGNTKYNTATQSISSSTTLTAITDLSQTLVAGKTYAFEIHLPHTGNASYGMKAGIGGGSVTATNVWYCGTETVSGGTAPATTCVNGGTTMTTAVCAVTASALGECKIWGGITVNAGGTFIPQFAQNVSGATATILQYPAWMMITPLN